MSLMIALAVIVVTILMALALWFDPQNGQTSYSYYHDTNQVNSNDLSAAISGYYTRALFVVTAILSVVAVVQIGFLIRADKNARDAMVADQRAFVFASNIRGEWRKDPATGKFTWLLKPIWRNSGKTPTRNLRVMTSGEIRERPISNEIDPTKDDGPPSLASGLLGPSFESFGGGWPLTNQLTAQDVADLVAGRKFCYLWGHARYFDVFNRDVEHITRFCWIVTALGDPTKVPKGLPCPQIQWGFVQHMRGNCADDECNA